jgi:hypothetical protein
MEWIVREHLFRPFQRYGFHNVDFSQRERAFRECAQHAKAREKYKMWNPQSIPLDTHTIRNARKSQVLNLSYFLNVKKYCKS